MLNLFGTFGHINVTLSINPHGLGVMYAHNTHSNHRFEIEEGAKKLLKFYHAWSMSMVPGIELEPETASYYWDLRQLMGNNAKWFFLPI